MPTLHHPLKTPGRDHPIRHILPILPALSLLPDGFPSPDVLTAWLLPRSLKTCFRSQMHDIAMKPEIPSLLFLLFLPEPKPVIRQEKGKKLPHFFFLSSFFCIQKIRTSVRIPSFYLCINGIFPIVFWFLAGDLLPIRRCCCICSDRGDMLPPIICCPNGTYDFFRSDPDLWLILFIYVSFLHVETSWNMASPKCV